MKSTLSKYILAAVMMCAGLLAYQIFNHAQETKAAKQAALKHCVTAYWENFQAHQFDTIKDTTTVQEACAPEGGR